MARKKADGKHQEKQKHAPQRVCIACREAAGKRGLIRIVRTTGGVEIDLSGKMPGRGAYLHPRPDCWKNALETNRIGQSLRTKVSAEAIQKLETFSATLTEPAG